jgi:hypothetical protein
MLLTDLRSSDPYNATFSATDALYLKMHYGRMSDSDIEIMFRKLRGTTIRGIHDFIFAYWISKYGYEPAFAGLGKDVQRYFETHNYDLTLIRELTAIGRYDLVMTNLKQIDWPKDHRYEYPIALPLIDYPAARRQSLAQTADQNGQTLFAGGLYASLPSHETWPGFLKRNVEKEGFKDRRGSYVIFSGYNFDSPPLPDPRNRANSQQYVKFVQTIVTTSWLEPEMSLLYRFASRFKREPIYPKRAAPMLKAAFDRGELRPDGSMDRGWLLIFRALAEVSGDPDMIVRRMQRVVAPSRHYLQANAGYVLDTMLAAEAIGPWLRGEIKIFPSAPPLASGALKTAWPEWRAMAETIKAGAVPDNLERNFTRRGMAADLFYAKGDEKRLLETIAAEANPGFRQRLTIDFMARYDRLCDSRLYFPGAALFLRAATIHRFDDPK